MVFKLLTDKDIKDYTSRFGIYLEGHQTQNKYDLIYGVGSMQQLFEQKHNYHMVTQKAKLRVIYIVGN